MAELRNEEMTGFEPENDQETFLLEQQPYPGELWSGLWKQVTDKTGEAPQGSDGGGEALPEAHEWLADELRRVLREALQSSSRRIRQPQKQVESPAEPSHGAGRQGEVIEVDLSRLPTHPSQMLEEEQSLPELPPPAQEPGRRSRRKVPLVELLLGFLVLVGGGVLWYEVSQSGRKTGGEEKARGDTGRQAPLRSQEEGDRADAKQHAFRVPLRQLSVIEPLAVEVQLPLLQAPFPPTQTNTPQTNPTKTKPHSPPLPSTNTPLTPSVFTVQVYASRSYTDAAEFAEYLRRQGLPSVVVTSATIRGQRWWRVRFGNYPNRLQAEQEALKAGFSDVWIVPLQ